MRRSELPADPVRIACGERLLASALAARLPEDACDAARAAELAQSALETLRAELGDDDPEVAATRTLLARIAPSAEEALPLYEQALAVLERRPGEARRTIECLDGYAWALLAVDRLVQADELLRRSALLTRQFYGERHTVDHLRRRAQIEQLCGNLSGAELLARAALATEIDGWIEHHPQSERQLTALARRLRQDDPPPYAEAFVTLRGLRGNGDFELSSWANSLAVLMIELERPTEAEALLRESLNIYCRLYGLDCPNRMRTLFALADHLARCGRPDAARVWLEELLERIESTGLVNEDLVTQATDLAERLARTELGVAR